MKLIVGLGNPGKKYELTRHNMGFRVIDLLATNSKIDVDKEAFNALMGRGKIFNEDVILFKPLTFMNLSGNAVREVVNYFKIDINDIIVIFDDMSINPGHIRMRLNGSSGGQKGMQSIINNLKTDQIKRIRIGIGEPDYNAIDFVLGKPSKEEEPLISEAIEKAYKAIIESLKTTFEKSMSLYNG